MHGTRNALCDHIGGVDILYGDVDRGDTARQSHQHLCGAQRDECAARIGGLVAEVEDARDGEGGRSTATAGHSQLVTHSHTQVGGEFGSDEQIGTGEAGRTAHDLFRERDNPEIALRIYAGDQHHARRLAAHDDR